MFFGKPRSVMKLRHASAMAVDTIRHALAHPELPDRYQALVGTTCSLQSFRTLFAHDGESARQLIGLARDMRSATGQGLSSAEKMLMECMVSVAWTCEYCAYEAGAHKLKNCSAVDTWPPAAHSTGVVLGMLCDHAVESLEFPARPRDSFASKRRAAAFDILTHAAALFDLPEALALARRTILTASSGDAYAAVSFIESYFSSRANRSLPKDIVRELRAVPKTANNRSTVYVALNMLVESGIISELEALDRMDNWKSKHYR